MTPNPHNKFEHNRPSRFRDTEARFGVSLPRAHLQSYPARDYFISCNYSPFIFSWPNGRNMFLTTPRANSLTDKNQASKRKLSEAVQAAQLVVTGEAGRHLASWPAGLGTEHR